MVTDPALIAPDERDNLCSLGGRRAARKTLKQTHGRAAARALHQLQRQQLRLLMSLGRWGQSSRTERHAAAVLASRAALKRAIL